MSQLYLNSSIRVRMDSQNRAEISFEPSLRIIINFLRIILIMPKIKKEDRVLLIFALIIPLNISGFVLGS